jgi:hypothetical protein
LFVVLDVFNEHPKIVYAPFYRYIGNIIFESFNNCLPSYAKVYHNQTQCCGSGMFFPGSGS